MSTAQNASSPPRRKQSLPGSFPSPPPTPVISSQQSLAQAVYERRAEYIRPQKIRVKVGTWNVASRPGTEKDIKGWFIQGKGVSESLSGLTINEEDSSNIGEHGSHVQNSPVESVSHQEERTSKKSSTIPQNDPGMLPGGGDIGLYVLGLQEIIDITSVTEALRPFTDQSPARKWKSVIQEALPKGYELVAEQQLIGLLLLVYASPLVAPMVSSVSTTSVGTGLGGYMGNKGAVTARIFVGETTRMVFVNCHLSAGAEKGSVERRNWDASQILSRTRFDPIEHGGVVEDYGEGIGDEDFAFWFGDLNYRLDTLAGDDVRRLLMLHTRNEYDTRQKSLKKIERELAKAGIPPEDPTESGRRSEDSSTSSHTEHTLASDSSSTTLPDDNDFDPAADPASLQTTLSSLLPHDQLHKQMRLRKAFHDGWKEGPITFLPTYKYDVGSVGMFDSSEKKRGPSWCDRILYRSRKDRQEYLKKVHEEEEARRRDDEMKAKGLDKSEDDEVLYDYDPDTDGADDAYEENVNINNEDDNVVITKTGFEERLILDYYTSHQRVLSSDHKPLDAVFTLDYDAVDPELRAHIQQEVARELDKAENEGRPTITVVIDRHADNSGTPDESINFGDVRYDHPKTRSATIANTGRVPATFGFIGRHGSDVFPSWLEVRFDRPHNAYPLKATPEEYTLEPGDATNVEFTVHITDVDQVRRLNEGHFIIEDVLVLRVQNGRDHFLPVRGSWLQSSFGRSLDKLIRLPEGGVRRLQHQKPEGSGSSSDSKEELVKWSAPREIFRLTEAIEELVERATAERGMIDDKDAQPWDMIGWPFRKDSWVSSAERREVIERDLRDALDKNEKFYISAEVPTVQKVEALSVTLLKFLDSLEDGVLNQKLWEELSKGMDEREKSKKPISGEEMRSWVLDTLSSSPAHSVTFIFLSFMLARVANEIAPLPSIPPTPLTPKTPDTLLGRSRALSHDPVISRRQQIDRKFAEIFANVMIKAPLPVKAKEKKLEQDKRSRVIEVFLRSRWEESL
jgi:phosphatidylinositol-bisphosphatase